METAQSTSAVKGPTPPHLLNGLRLSIIRTIIGRGDTHGDSFVPLKQFNYKTHWIVAAMIDIKALSVGIKMMQQKCVDSKGILSIFLGPAVMCVRARSRVA